MGKSKNASGKSKADSVGVSSAKIRYTIVKELRRIWSWYAPERKAVLNKATEWHEVTKLSKLSNPYQVKEKFIRCAICGKLFKPVDIQVDHVERIGKFPEWPPDPNKNDWNVYLSNMFCSAENLQPLCKEDHAQKTREESKRDK